MRQVGVGSQGGAEALAISHQPIFDDWVSGSLNTPLHESQLMKELLRHGRLECGEELGNQPRLPTRCSRRMEASRFLCGTRRGETFAKNRGPEQGDVDGPLECSLPLGMVAAEAQLHVAGQQAAGTVPLVGSNDQEERQRLRNKYQSSMLLYQNF